MNANEAVESRSSSPSERLAKEIAEKLVDEMLILPSKRVRVEEGLAKGSLTEDDWSVLVEFALDGDGRK